MTLSERARSMAEHFEIRETELKLARAMSISTYDAPEGVVAIGQLLDGRRVKMQCATVPPSHIIDLRLV